LDKVPAREGADIVDGIGRVIGRITSGSFAPSLGAPIAMGYMDTAFADDGSETAIIVRGVSRPARVTPLPFVPHRYKRSS